jgi:hypothetical protein
MDSKWKNQSFLLMVAVKSLNKVKFPNLGLTDS